MARAPKDGDMSDYRAPRNDSDRRGLTQPARAQHTQKFKPASVIRALCCTNDRPVFGELPAKLKPQMIAMAAPRSTECAHGHLPNPPLRLTARWAR
jgi:hypothetical protein